MTWATNWPCCWWLTSFVLLANRQPSLCWIVLFTIHTISEFAIASNVWTISLHLSRWRIQLLYCLDLLGLHSWRIYLRIEITSFYRSLDCKMMIIWSLGGVSLPHCRQIGDRPRFIPLTSPTALPLHVWYRKYRMTKVVGFLGWVDWCLRCSAILFGQ